MPGCMASSTRRSFSLTDQRRRRCTEVMTSTRRSGSSGLLDIVVLIGACLCLIGYADCLVRTGCTPRIVLMPDAPKDDDLKPEPKAGDGCQSGCSTPSRSRTGSMRRSLSSRWPAPGRGPALHRRYARAVIARRQTKASKLSGSSDVMASINEGSRP